MNNPAEPLANADHERFACEWAKGGGIAASYKRAGYKPSASAATRLAKIVKGRKTWLQRQAAFADVLTIAEKRAFVARLVRAKAGKLSADSDLWQAVKVTKDGAEYRLADKLAAMKIDNDLASEGAEAGLNRAIEVIIHRL